MWPGERERLAVWADELQARGHALGEVVALSLQAEQLGESEQAQVLAREAEARRVGLALELLGPGFEQFPQARLRWQCGVVRALVLGDWSSQAEISIAQITALLLSALQRPVFQWLEHLEINYHSTFLQERELFEAIYDPTTDPATHAQPRRVVFGGMPRSFRRIRVSRGRVSLHVRELEFEPAVARGLTWYLHWDQVQALPWASGDAGSRLAALEQLLAGPWSDTLARRLACACWDPSLRVRRRVLEVLPQLPDEAAPMLLPVLAMHRDGQRVFGDVVERCVTRIAAERPTWVAAVAEEFGHDEEWVARWLAGVGRRSRTQARAAIPRIAGMLARLQQTHLGAGWRGTGMRQALRSFGEAERLGEVEDETIDELLRKR